MLFINNEQKPHFFAFEDWDFLHLFRILCASTSSIYVKFFYLFILSTKQPIQNKIKQNTI